MENNRNTDQVCKKYFCVYSELIQGQCCNSNSREKYHSVGQASCLVIFCFNYKDNHSVPKPIVGPVPHIIENLSSKSLIITFYKITFEKFG